MNTKWLTNPFFVYSLGFLLVFLVYQARWSDRYPPLSTNLVLFLFATFSISFLFAFILEKSNRNEFAEIEVDRNRILIVSLLYVGYFMEFAYSGGVPILLTMTNPEYSYKDFTGIPTFHVILGTFGVFYSIYLFHQYLCSTEKLKAFFYFFISLVPNILVINRGAVVIIIIASFVIYLMKLKRLSIKSILRIFLSIIGIIYLFGIIGNIRYSVSKEDKEFILRIGGASDEFIKGNVPSEYYWGYLYIATPVGNLQNIIDKKESEFSIRRVPSFMASELLPDFISKRFVAALGTETEADDASKFFVIEALNAPTVYYRSYFLLGWTGVVMMYLYSIVIMLCYPYFVPRNSPYFISGWACLVTIVLLNIFSNMWYASGTILIWPLIATFLGRIKIYKNNVT